MENGETPDERPEDCAGESVDHQPNFGVGFDQSTEALVQGMGRMSMKETARLGGGSLTVASLLGQNTTVTTTVPLDHHA